MNELYSKKLLKKEKSGEASYQLETELDSLKNQREEIIQQVQSINDNLTLEIKHLTDSREKHFKEAFEVWNDKQVEITQSFFQWLK